MNVCDCDCLRHFFSHRDSPATSRVRNYRGDTKAGFNIMQRISYYNLSLFLHPFDFLVTRTKKFLLTHGDFFALKQICARKSLSLTKLFGENSQRMKWITRRAVVFEMVTKKEVGFEFSLPIVAAQSARPFSASEASWSFSSILCFFGSEEVFKQT